MQEAGAQAPKTSFHHFPLLGTWHPAHFFFLAGACKQIKKMTSHRHRSQQTPTENWKSPPAKCLHRALSHTAIHCCPDTLMCDHCSQCQLLHKHLSPNLCGVCSGCGDITHMLRHCQPMCEPGSGSMADPGCTAYSDQSGINIWIFPYEHGCTHTHMHTCFLPQLSRPGCP